MIPSNLKLKQLAWTVNKLRQDRYPKLSGLKLLCHPQAAHDVCVSVRMALLFAWSYSDFRILRTYCDWCTRSRLHSRQNGKRQVRR
jgi:hypothetical protein